MIVVKIEPVNNDVILAVAETLIRQGFYSIIINFE
jgi:hypothetical protein